MSLANDPKEIKRYELTEVYSHPDAKVDIVLVHGLNGHPQKTWTSATGVFWPSQLLPVTLKSAKARILVYGYNADVYTFGKGGASSDMIYHQAQTLLANLALERTSEEASDHPIIWVAHSLGGILVKRALNLSTDFEHKDADDLRSIAISTYGIIFLGTPHTGSDPAKWGLMLQSMVNALIPKAILHTEGQLVKTLKTNNEELQEINLKFLQIYDNYKIYMVHEGVPTDLKGTKMFIVDQAAASPLLQGVKYYGIEATHSGMCKFETKNSPGYSNISGAIKSWVQESPQVIETRRQSEMAGRWQKKNTQIAELLGYRPPPLPTQHTQGSTGLNTPDPSSLNNSTIIVKSTASIEPDEENEEGQIFIKPSGFRPNSLFVGREKELSDMHKMLLDQKTRNEGTSAILIQSLPGGGKTHLTRQYVYEHRDDYPGGIFWLRAKSQEELAAGFWNIAKNVVLKHAVDKDDAASNPQQFIEAVRKWFNHRHDWLLVLDGIRFDDTESLQQFIPDNVNTSLIYTSTERAVSGDYHLMNPRIIRLPLLSAREAQKLLLLELDKHEPFSKDDLVHSMELVQAMGFLPVVIHSVAQRLKMTGESLHRFAKSYTSEPRLRGLDTYRTVADQLKAMGAAEALNLIYIICFFNQHIPVEMISLGLRALDDKNIKVKAFDQDHRRSLNNTFEYLIRFALMDRNEADDLVRSSQSSKSSRDMLAENVDVIRLHGVVQGFFIDTLNAEESLPLWLGRAVNVFCCSYDTASLRIERKTHAGLVEDYRLYEIHGFRLLQHVKRYEKRYPKIAESHRVLDQYLENIKTEIEQRTLESSQTMAEGRSGAFQASIFDRTSSSSDTASDTPKHLEKHYSGMPWGFEQQHESPTSITHDKEYIRHAQAGYMDAEHHDLILIPPMTPSEDDGYASDHEGSVAMTIMPSQRTMQQNGLPISPNDGTWEVVKTRRPKKASSFGLHRTINRMEKQRYRDRAGSYRSINAIDPRLSHETAQGYLQRTSSRAQSRGRISGQSSAEVALTHISHASPPPARGGGMIRDRSAPASQKPERPRLMVEACSYAAAVANATNDSATRSRDIPRPPTEYQNSAAGSVSSSAMASLQKFPINNFRLPTFPRSPYTPLAMPPYPPSPSLTYQQPFHFSDTALYDSPGRFDNPMHDTPGGDNSIDLYSQENQKAGPTPSPPTIYPAMLGKVPVDTMQILTYYPGRPELSFSGAADQYDGGYTSQPMSRDPSGQSNRSTYSAPAAQRGRGIRRASVTMTEPPVRLPSLSPRIPNSYEVYQQKTDPEFMYLGHERERSDECPVRNSPRIGYSNIVTEESLEQWDGDANYIRSTGQRQFNPAIAPFRPRNQPTTFSNRTHSASISAHTAYQYPISTLNQGPQHHSAPPSNVPSQYPSPAFSQGQNDNSRSNRSSSQRNSPYQAQSPFPPPPPLRLTQTSQGSHKTNSRPNTGSQRGTPNLPYQAQPPFPPPPPQTNHRANPTLPFQTKHFNSTPSHPQHRAVTRSFTDLEEFDVAPPMGRSGSGGVMIGNGQVIEFGDFPEAVNIQGARERVVRGWEGLRRVNSEKNVWLGIQDGKKR